MSQSYLTSLSTIKVKIKPKKPIKQFSNSRESSLESKKIPKGFSSTFSPYAISLHKQQDSNDIILQKSIKNSSKDISSFKRNSSNNSMHSFNRLIAENSKKALHSNLKLSRKLTKKLEDLYESADYIDLYIDIFDEIISNDKDFSSPLMVLKNRMRSLIKNQKAENENLATVVKTLESIAETLKADNQKITKKNQELQEQNQSIGEKLNEITEKYVKLAKIEIEDKDVNIESIRKLKQENIIYQDLVFKLKEEVDYYKKKTKKFCRLVNLIEAKGIPVEEIYLTEMKKRRVIPNYAGNSEPESNTENEYIESKREVQKKKKNKKIPDLKLNKIEKESSSESENSSGEPSDNLIEM